MNPFKTWNMEQVVAFNKKNLRSRGGVAGSDQTLNPSVVAGKIVANDASAGPQPVPPISVNVSVQPTTDESALNKTERAYLNLLRSRGLPWIGVQNITLKLANDCRYTPDFNTIGPNGEFEFREVKGFMREDANVKLKTAARAFRWAKFLLVRKVKGGWEETEIKP